MEKVNPLKKSAAHKSAGHRDRKQYHAARFWNRCTGCDSAAASRTVSEVGPPCGVARRIAAEAGRIFAPHDIVGRVHFSVAVVVPWCTGYEQAVLYIPAEQERSLLVERVQAQLKRAGRIVSESEAAQC